MDPKKYQKNIQLIRLPAGHCKLDCSICNSEAIIRGDIRRNAKMDVGVDVHNLWDCVNIIVLRKIKGH